MLSSSDEQKIDEMIKIGDNRREVNRALALKMRSKGWTAVEIASILLITPRTVFNIQRNYKEGGLSKALHDDPRPGARPKFDDSTKAEIVALVCSDPPDGFDRWTLDLIVEKSKEANIVNDISRETIRIILEEHDLQPWRQKMWCIPEINDEYKERMENILNLYESSSSKDFPLVCLDEKPIQLLEDFRPSSGLLPGEVRKVDYAYKRHDTANVFCVVAPKDGIYMNVVTERKKGSDFAQMLKRISEKFKHAKRINLVMDNYSTHKLKFLIEAFGKEKGENIWNRFKIFYTPIHASWLNQAEIAINMYARQCLGKSRIPDIETLKKKTSFWNKCINEKKVTVDWKFTTKDAKEKFEYN